MLVAALGLTGCAAIQSDAALCQALPVEALATALLAHPETPDPVGEAGTDVVIGWRAGCGR